MVWYANAEGRYGEAGRKGDTGEMVVERYLNENNIQYDKKEAAPFGAASTKNHGVIFRFYPFG